MEHINNPQTPQTPQHHLTDFDLICKHILDSLPVGIVAFDTNLKIIRANDQSRKMLNIDTQLWQLDMILTAGTDPAIWQNWTGILKEAIEQDSLKRIENVSFDAPDGKKLFLIFCKQLKDPNSNDVIGGTITIEDITDRIKIERQMESIERFAAVGKLAGKVAHELNNPMDGILRYINLTSRILEKENLEKPLEYLSQCRKGLMRMVQIISELLEFSRSTHNAFENMYLQDIIEDAIRSMEHKIAAQNISIVKEFANDIPRLTCGSLYQVFCNLIKNSIDAIGTDGTVTIHTQRENNNAIIEFIDNGPGIDPEVINEIFEPFFTTKKQGKGTGLGLAICKDIIEKYNGTITAHNIPQGGSKFKVTLPLTSQTIVSPE
jgi:two-component system sensor histidine kinase AtoS